MIIGIDISSIQYGTGVSNYTINLIKNLVKVDKTNTYKLFYSSLRNPIPTDIKNLADKRIIIKHFRFPQSLLAFIWNRLHILPIELFIGKCHIFHTSDYNQPPTLKAKTITTIHDLTPFLYPQWLHSNIVKNHSLKMKYAIKNCSHFICVSKNSQTDLLRLFPSLDVNKTSVIYEACEQKYKNFSTLNAKQKQSIIKQTKHKYKLNNFILAQGTRQPRKNLNRLIEAFIDFKNDHPNSNLNLAIAGKYGWGQDLSQDQPSYIKILGYIPEEDMVGIHASAFALVYPSLYEGFGLPVLKSMAVGVPVITSQNSSMSEIANNSAILINPKSIKGIKSAINKIYTDSKLYQSLIKRGITNSNKYSWTNTAKQTLEIYNKL